MKIGVLGNETSWYVDQICRAATAAGCLPVPLQFPRLQAAVSSGCIEFSGDGVELNALDALVIRTMPAGTLEQVVFRMDLLAGLETSGVRIVNPPKADECAVDKYLTIQRLAHNGVSVPDTIVCENSDAALDAFSRLGGDVVVKPLFGAEGRGIVRVDQVDLALRVFRTLERIGAVLYLQKFIARPKRDIRILLLDGEVVAAVSRKPMSGEFRANASLNGSAEPYQPTELERHLAQQAADTTGCIFAGVDLMVTEEGNPLVIEVNAVPGWKAISRACGVDVARYFIEWLKKTHRPVQARSSAPYDLRQG